jgi:PhzF family phenazine biosynthesis protein
MSIEVLRYAAFPDAGRGGNPAGVVLGTSLTDAQMLAVAQAIGYSETAFLTRRDGRSVIRFFSPRAEVDFCGHATIATAVAVAQRDGAGTLSLATNAGPVEVRTAVDTDGTVTATLTSPATSTVAVAESTLRRALDHLRLAPSDLDPAFPAHVSYAGNHHLVLAVTAEHILDTLDYDYAGLDQLMAEQGWTTVHVFCRRDATTYAARNLFPPGGVVEDPATGAAAAAFGGYLRDLRLMTVPGRLTIVQGVAMGAPSRLVVDIDPSRHVRVTGTATRLELSPYDDLELP